MFRSRPESGDPRRPAGGAGARRRRAGTAAGQAGAPATATTDRRARTPPPTPPTPTRARDRDRTGQRRSRARTPGRRKGRGTRDVPSHCHGHGPRPAHPAPRRSGSAPLASGGQDTFPARARCFDFGGSGDRRQPAPVYGWVLHVSASSLANLFEISTGFCSGVGGRGRSASAASRIRWSVRVRARAGRARVSVRCRRAFGSRPRTVLSVWGRGLLTSASAVVGVSAVVRVPGSGLGSDNIVYDADALTVFLVHVAVGLLAVWASLWCVCPAAGVSAQRRRIRGCCG